ncbi:MAG: glutathione S-transferase family protein [Cyanobacteria bacterium P01_G01_bin.54]
MLELYQFELSQYSEKVRLILDYKGLDYHKIEVTPGVGQLELFQKTGQRQVPVLKDGETYIPDSTEIALYLERQYPEKPLIPTTPKAKGLCLALEEWADVSIGLKGRIVLLGALNKNSIFRASLLPKTVPDLFRGLVGAIPSELLDILGTGVGLGGEEVNAAEVAIKQDLEALCLMLQNSPYLLGDTPSLADLAVAGLSIILKYPEGDYIELPEQFNGKGIPGFADNPAYAVFFDWRDRLYAQFRQPLSGSSTPSNS